MSFTCTDLEESEASYITNLLYGSTEAEPISTISAKEKMELEGTQCACGPLCGEACVQGQREGHQDSGQCAVFS